MVDRHHHELDEGMVLSVDAIVIDQRMCISNWMLDDCMCRCLGNFPHRQANVPAVRTPIRGPPGNLTVVVVPGPSTIPDGAMHISERRQELFCRGGVLRCELKLLWIFCFYFGD